jgi:hypothetical protein
MTTLRRGALAALIGLALTACGTTVQQPPTTGAAADSLGTAAPDGLAPAGAAGATGPPVTGTSRVDAAGSPTVAGGEVAPGSSTTVTSTDVRTGGSGGATVTARGLTATQISIGVVTTQDAATVGKSIGAENLVGGDHVAEIDALLKHINSRGGIAGRKAVAVYQDVRTSDSTSAPAAAAQAACDGLTEDKQVFAVISIVGNLNNDVMYQCMSKHHTPFFGVDLAPHHASAFAKYAPHVYGAHTLVLERLVPTLVSRLAAQSYFSGWDTAAGAPSAVPAKVGVLYADADPGYLQLAKSALSRAGHPAADSFGYKSDLSTLGSQMQSAVLQFRQHGVTHVLIEESDGVLFFLPAAENQSYRPRYGFTSLNGAKALADTQTVPARQFVGMRGIGWAPAIDVGNTKTESVAAAACRRVMKDAGIDTADSTAFFYMAVECDAFLLLKAGLERQQSFTPIGLRQGMEALGTQFPAAAVIGIAWHPRSYDGVSALLDFGYDNGTFAYRGSPHPT